MRHRITSFRCVEAREKMIHPGAQRKTCIDANNRQSSSLRAGNSGAAILHHASQFWPCWNDERGRAAGRESHASAAVRHRIEQWIIALDLSGQPARRRIEPCGEPPCRRARPHVDEWRSRRRRPRDADTARRPGTVDPQLGVSRRTGEHRFAAVGRGSIDPVPSDGRRRAEIGDCRRRLSGKRGRGGQRNHCSNGKSHAGQRLSRSTLA